MVIPPPTRFNFEKDEDIMAKETAVNALEQFLSEDQQKNKKRSWQVLTDSYDLPYQPPARRR